MRYFFTTAYKGTGYHGWQKQPNAISVQQKIEEAFSKVLNQSIDIIGSGRTDTGVHATQQVFQIDLPEPYKPEQLLFQCNKVLPKDIALISVRTVKGEAHARFDAVSRSYQYKIVRHKDAFLKDLVYYFTLPLNVGLMNEACEVFKEYTDFESFSKVKTDVNTFNCSIFEAVWKQENDLLVFHVSANRFLRGMVRAIVGTLLEVGLGKLTIPQFKQIIEQKDRKAAGRAVPAHGLFLTEVKYPEDIYIKL